MNTHFIWIEGIDFDQHIDDTNDLSTMRGSSLALLGSGHASHSFLLANFKTLLPELVFSGASIALIKLSGDDTAVVDARGKLANWLASTDSSREIPLQHMRFAIGHSAVVASGKNVEKAAIQAAQADARTRQMTGDYPRIARKAGSQPCSFSRILPADSFLDLPAHQARDYGVTADSGAKYAKVPVSASVKARRDYGRKARQAFYKDRLALDSAELERYRFTDNLHDLVGNAPDGIASSLENKIAVLYADGNQFTSIREAMGGDVAALKKFSEMADEVMRECVLKTLLAPFRNAAHQPDQELLNRYAYLESGEKPQLRFETLLFGGDEVAFVMPAWLAFEAAQNLMAVLAADKRLEVVAHKLTFACGVAIASYKTPIKLLRGRAKDLAEHCKETSNQESRIALQIYESIEAPLYGIDHIWNAALCGQTEKPQYEKVIGAKIALAIEAADFNNRFVRVLKGILGGSEKTIPRSQLYKWLRAARHHTSNQEIAGLGSTRADEKISNEIEYWNTRSGDGKFKPEMGKLLGDGTSLATNIWMITQIWDYAFPFDDEMKEGHAK